MRSLVNCGWRTIIPEYLPHSKANYLAKEIGVLRLRVPWFATKKRPLLLRFGLRVLSRLWMAYPWQTLIDSIVPFQMGPHIDATRIFIAFTPDQ